MKYLVKNKKYSFMIIFFIVSFFFIGNAYALVYEQAGWYNLDSAIKSGSLTGTSNGTNININLGHNVANYDYLAYKMSRYNFTTNPTLVDTDIVHYCTKYGQYTEISPTTHPVYTCESTGSDTLQDYQYPSVDYTISAVIVNSNGQGSGCFFSSSYEGYLICPTNRLNGNADHITINISYNGNNSSATLNYAIALSQTVNYLNDDSTDIINALSGVQTQQVNTISAIEQQTQQQAQQNAYVQSSNISQAQTNTSDNITVLNDQLTQELSQFSDLTQLVVAPITLFMELNNNVCAPLTLQIPFVNQTAVLPCIKPIMQQYFGGMYSVFTTVIGAILCYWTFVRTVALIKDLVDADNDKIEVVDL